jgi:hypothetical protein
MRRTSHVAAVAAAALLAAGAVTVVSHPAYADDTIRRPGDHPRYHVEVEPHLSLGVGGVYGFYGGEAGLGFIPGVRIGIPIVENGFIPKINNSVAISFGFDPIYYSGCWFGPGSCSAWYIELPVTMQWNFYVAQHWSVFGEPGFFLYHGFYSDCFFNGNRDFCGAPNGYAQTGVLPAFYVGARYHFSDHVTLTMRVGYPTFSIGVSFLP